MMGYAGIPQSVLVSICVTTLMGVAMDDSLLFVLFYRNNLLRYSDSRLAASETLRQNGSVIVRTSVILILGLTVLLFSRYVPMVENALLMMGGLVVSTVGALTVVPSLLVATSNRRKERS
jgi:predicted RND superfamily exporter protein